MKLTSSLQLVDSGFWYSFQTDVENMREELHFKDHKLSEWENLLRTERDKIKSLENELEVT